MLNHSCFVYQARMIRTYPKPLLFGLPATPSSVNNIIETSEQEAQRWLNRIKQQVLEDENNRIKLITAILIASIERMQLKS